MKSARQLALFGELVVLPAARTHAAPGAGPDEVVTV